MQSPSPPVSASELASSWTPFPIITTNQLNTAARPTPVASQPKSDRKSDNRSLMRCRQSELVKVLPCWAKAERPGHFTEKEEKAPPPPGIPELGTLGEDDLLQRRQGRLRGASGAIPDVQESTETLWRPRICLPNAAGFPGPGRSREMQTSKCRHDRQ